MQITDPIADMLTRIRNAGSARHETVDIPNSKMKKAIAEILLEEGYIKSFQLIDDGTQGVIRVTLKYLPGKEKAIQGLRRVSKPGLRVYAGADELPQVLRGLGIAIISTSKGIMTDKKARARTSAAKSSRLCGNGRYRTMSRIGRAPHEIPGSDKSPATARSSPSRAEGHPDAQRASGHDRHGRRQHHPCHPSER